MLRDAWFLGWSDLRYMLRQRETLLWTFLMPVVFFYFIGTVTGGSRSFGGGADTLAVRVGEDAGYLVEALLERLEGEEFRIVRTGPAGAGAPEPAGAEGEASAPFESYARRLAIPAGFTRAVLDGEGSAVVLGGDADGISGDYDRFRVGRAVYTLLAELVVAGEARASGAPSHEDLIAVRGAERALRIDVRQAGRRERIPTGFEQAVPGTMVMFTLLVLLTSGATTLVVERRLGLLRRLASAPVRRGAVVLGKWGAKWVLGLVQVGFAMLLGRYFFGVDWGPRLPMLLLCLASYAALIASLGMLAGNFARSEGQAVGLGVLAANVLGALGGCWWPIEVTPSFMQRLALFLPTGWAMDAVHRLVSFQQEAAAVLPHVAGMALGAWVLGLVCARTFRFE